MDELECPFCGHPEARTEIIPSAFIYANKTLIADVPVHTCEGCSQAWEGIDGERARDEAIRIYQRDLDRS